MTWNTNKLWGLNLFGEIGAGMSRLHCYRHRGWSPTILSSTTKTNDLKSSDGPILCSSCYCLHETGMPQWQLVQEANLDHVSKHFSDENLEEWRSKEFKIHDNSPAVKENSPTRYLPDHTDKIPSHFKETESFIRCLITFPFWRYEFQNSSLSQE